jgi:hypothetical protein
VIHVGAPLPTRARAQLFFFGAIAASIAAAGAAAVLVYRLAGKRLGLIRDRSEQDPYSSGTSPQDLKPRTLQQSPVANICSRLAIYVVPAAVVGGVASYCLMRIGIVPAGAGFTGMAVCVAMIFIVGGAALLAGRQFREYEYERIDPSQLSRKERRHFEMHTPQIEQLGFRHVGDVRLRGNVDTCMRQFLSVDEKTLAFLECSPVTKAITFDSVMSDGVYLVTSDFDCTEFSDPSLPKRFQHVTGTPENLLAAHQLVRRQYEVENQAEALTVGPDQISVVLDYAHRVAGWSMYRRGYHRSPPPPLPRFNSIEMLASLLNRGSLLRAGGAF